MSGRTLSNGHEESATRHGQASEPIPRRGSDRTDASAEGALPPRTLPPPTDADDPRQSVTKPSTARVPPGDAAEGQPSFRSNFLQLNASSNSRTSSARTSTSSLQALNEDTVVDARSDPSAGSSSVSQRMSQQLGPLDIPPTEYPVYPDQTYASLQSQVHPTWQPPFLRTRSSYPSRADTRVRIFPTRPSRTAGNSPTSSPGLFSVRGLRTPPFIASDDEGRISSPYLHPTHLQPPKE